MSAGHRYSRWDGTQAPFEVDAATVMAEVGHDVLYHGDVAAALRRALHGGFADRNGRRVRGLREILEDIAQRRREELESHNLGGVTADIARELREIVDTERELLDDLGESGAEGAAGRAVALRERLDLLPPDLAGQVRALDQYPFASDDARRRFEDLVARLRDHLMAGQAHRMAAQVSPPSPEELARMKDGFAVLNEMLDRRAAAQAAGQDHPPDEQARFEALMASYGDLFGAGAAGAATLDELLEQLARQMAATQALLNSLSPEQRAEVEALAEQVLGDLDLRWQLDQFRGHLAAAFPGLGWDRSYDPSGADPLGFEAATELMDRLTRLDQIEQLLRSALAPGALADIDPDDVRDLLGEQAEADLDQLARLTDLLREAGLIDQREGRLALTPRGLRQLGQRALDELFAGVDKDRLGGHPLTHSGAGVEPAAEPKPYEWGDPFQLDIGRTVRNAVLRQGGGLPVHLDPSDFEVYRTEGVTRAATVVALDLSLSMPMRDNFLAAKKVALAMHSLISSRFPKDFLGLVGFGELARTIHPEDLPEVSWDLGWGTNLEHALALSRRLLAHQPGSRQIVLVTDGEPTAHILPGGSVFYDYPPAPETLRATLAEVARCTAAGIRINTFMLDATDALVGFVERLARMNRGRVFATTPETLGRYVLVDFLENRRVDRRRVG